MRQKNLFSLRNILFAALIAATMVFASCKQYSKEPEPSRVELADWVYSATIYEVNVRQYTPEGTFKAFEQHLPRLKDLGVDILWFMPIHPIGIENRKGTLGSYYSVKDYYGINPEFGTLDDFKSVVAKAHELGMKVIIDVVANHTAHDAVLITDHPDWYVYDSLGRVVSPYDWTDVAKLDYSKPELRRYMIDMLKYWIQEVDLDGFRCDVAAEVPTDFWNEARAELNKLGKPIFMLAEAETPELQKYAFDADYAWEFHHILNSIAQGKKSVVDLEQYLLKKAATYPKNTIKMNFITNHDENSWNGTEFERMGDAVKTMAALTFVIDGMPLIYTGQEVGLNHRLQFFEKDQVVWTVDKGFTNFYKKLTALKKVAKVLDAGDRGADIFRITTTADSSVFAFVRENETQKLFAIFNLSAKDQAFNFTGDAHLNSSYVDYFNNSPKTFTKGEGVTLKPWEFSIYLSNK
ncbi:MAG TPA: alpha-amylase [Bacteroidales bacterium]|nr:alpha-amylase [Bacteroidales bacterium]